MKVKCPTCKKIIDYGPDNVFRPFCSERCRTLDLGAWADEKYRVPIESTPSPSEVDDVLDSLERPPNHQLN